MTKSQHVKSRRVKSLLFSSASAMAKFHHSCFENIVDHELQTVFKLIVHLLTKTFQITDCMEMLICSFYFVSKGPSRHICQHESLAFTIYDFMMWLLK